MTNTNRNAGCHQTLTAIYVGSLPVTVYIQYVCFERAEQVCNLMCWFSHQIDITDDHVMID